jgi:hypothetical protein
MSSDITTPKGRIMKKEYNVVFHYSVRVQAEDEETAEDMAWEQFGKADPTNTDHFACTVDAVEDVWATNEEGDYTCVDCHDPISDEAVLGHRKFGEPRCEDCYETHKYRA